MGEHAGPGWFDDPLDTSCGQHRWWNGEEWTRHVVPKMFESTERVALTGRQFHVAGPHGVEAAVLEELRRVLYEMVTSGEALDGRSYDEASFDGSYEKGAAVILATRELMLRAYNVAADQLIGDLAAGGLNHSLHALSTARLQIDDMGTAVGLRIADEYHAVRIRELELVAQLIGWGNVG